MVARHGQGKWASVWNHEGFPWPTRPMPTDKTAEVRRHRPPPRVTDLRIDSIGRRLTDQLVGTSGQDAEGHFIGALGLRCPLHHHQFRRSPVCALR